jgi:acetoin utilization protein AcuB
LSFLNLSLNLNFSFSLKRGSHMFVRDYMTKHPALVEPAMSIVEAQSIMAETRTYHLPVVESGKRLVGLISRANLRIPPAELSSLNVWEITRFLSSMKVKDLMVKQKDVITIDPDATIEEAAQIMVKNKIGCLPVVQDGIVVGIITEVDLLAQLAEMMASRLEGVRVTVRMPDRRGELAKLVSAINAQGWGITALGGAPSPRDAARWDAVAKIRSVSIDQVVAVLEQVPDMEIVDVRQI